MFGVGEIVSVLTNVRTGHLTSNLGSGPAWIDYATLTLLFPVDSPPRCSRA